MLEVDFGTGQRERRIEFAVVENVACRYGGGKLEPNQKWPQKAVSRGLLMKKRRV